MPQWPHSPLHVFNKKGSYIVTGATLNKVHFFQKDCELDLLQDLLLELAQHYQWRLEAWALFSNHYHFVGTSPEDASSLRKLITHFHAASSKKLNLLHQTPKRKVWYQYWDTQLTFQNSYLARLHYVMQNPVRHKIVEQAIEYPWCSANWFEKHANKSYYQTVRSFKIDSVQIMDDF